MDTLPFINEFKTQSLIRLNENTPRIEKCLALLNEEEVWKRPNAASNSIANLILHLCGNITQYIISSIGGGADNRVRDKEFATTDGLTKAELLDKITGVVQKASEVIQNVTADELMRLRIVQGFSQTGIDSIIHVVEHYSYHTGQIALLTKLMKNTDLGFYAGLDLNAKNS